MTLDREEEMLFVILQPDESYLVTGWMRSTGEVVDIELKASSKQVKEIILQLFIPTKT